MQLFERSEQLRPGIGGRQEGEEGIYISVRNLLKKDRTETSHSTETDHNPPLQTARLEWCWVCDILPLLVCLTPFTPPASSPSRAA